MSSLSSARPLTLLGVLAFAVSLDAQAIPTVSLLASSTQGVGNTANLYAGDYNGTTPTGGTFSDNALVVPPPGNFSGVYQSPFNNTPLLDTQSYFSVGAENGANGAPSPLSLVFGSSQNAFRLLWGSIDSYNTLQFYRGSTQIFSLTGTDVINDFGLGGAPQNYELVALLSFSFGATEMFNKVNFLSSQAAFEFALPGPRAVPEPPAVPEPSSLALLVVGLMGVHLLRRRRVPS